MVNVSLTQRDAIRSGGLFPKAFTLDHYAVVLQDQLPYLGTSLVIGIGTVAAHAARRGAGRLRAAVAVRARAGGCSTSASSWRRWSPAS